MPDGKVIFEINADDSDIKKKLDGVEDEAEDAADGMEKLGDSAEDAGKGFDAADVAIGSFVGNALTALASKLIETISSIAALAEETREYREDMAKLDTAFTTNGHSAETAQKTYDSFYRILGESDRTVEAVNHLAALTQNEEELAQWSTICAGVTARFGDSLPIEGLTEAANHTAKLGEVQGPLADALEWAGISTEEFNEKLAACNSEEERAALITSTLSGEYSEAGEAYNETTASTQAARDATNKLEQSQANLGKTIEPLTTAWTNMKANALQWFVDVGFPAMQKGWQWMKDNIPTVATVVAGLTAAMVGQKVANLANKAALEGMTIAQYASKIAQEGLNTALKNNAVGLIITGITLLVAGLVTLWNNCEGFRNFWIGLWENIMEVLAPVIEDLKQAFAQAWEAIKVVWDIVQPYFAQIWENIKIIFGVVKEWFNGMFSTAWEAIKAVWDGAKSYFSAIWETIKGIFAVVKAVLSGNWSDAWEAIKGIVSVWVDFFKGVWDSIKNVFSAVKDWFGNTFRVGWDAVKQVWANAGQFFSEIWGKIKSAFKVEEMLTIGKNIVEGIKNGVKSAWDNMVNWFKGLFGDLIGIAKKILGIKSPSRVFRDEIGKMIVAGIEVGIDDNADKPADAIRGVMDAMAKVLDEKHKTAKDTIKEYNSEIVQLEKDKDERLIELEEKFLADKKKKGADIKALEKQYTKDIENINEQHADKLETIYGNIKNTIDGKMQEIVSLEEKYKEDVKLIWEDLDQSIAAVQSNYDSQLENRVQSIASTLGIWSEASKKSVNGTELQKNLKSQVSVLEDYNKAIAKLEERGVDQGFVEFLKSMGVSSAGEIEAISKMSDKQLSEYVGLWEKKNALAKEAAVEELEPLKAETEKKIEELSDAALDKYTKLRADFSEQGALLLEELKLAMVEAGQGGYEEIIGQIDAYTSAGEDLMGGIVAGIANKSPALIDAVTNSVNRAIQAAKDAAGIASPSKVMKKEVGANLAEGINVGWSDKINSIKGTMADDMQGIVDRVRTAVTLENARMMQGVGVRDTGFSEVAQAVGMQTAGINSLASEYRRGSSANVTVPLVLNGRELGKAIIDLGKTENTRTGTSLVFA